MIYSHTDPTAYERAADLLCNGEVVALPTDTVYGLAADAMNPAAVRKLFQLKDRPASRSIAVLVADREAAEKLVRLQPAGQRLVARFWPGPMTLVAERRPDAPAHLGDNAKPTLGVRLPDDDLVRSLAVSAPLAATSANRHGTPTPTTAPEIARLFPRLEMVIDGGPRPSSASSVIDITGPLPVVLREGPIPASEIAAVAAEPASQRNATNPTNPTKPFSTPSPPNPLASAMRQTRHSPTAHHLIL